MLENYHKSIQRWSKKENSWNKTEGSKQDEKNGLLNSCCEKYFGTEEFLKYGKEKLLEKSLKNISLETTANMPVTSVPTNNELLNQL